MARWSDLAVWAGPTVNQGPGMNEYRGLVLHIAQGTYEGTISWQKNPAADVSSHFIVAEDGRCAQMVDTATAAWTQADGNGEWLSVEFAGFSGNPLTPQQVEVAAQLYARGVQLHGFPLQATDSPSGRGLGWHGMGGAAWGNHPNCPGEPIKAQRPAVLARATQLLGLSTPTQEDDVKFTIREPATGGVWLCDFIARRAVTSPAEWKRLLEWGASGRVGGIIHLGDLPATEPADWYGTRIDDAQTIELTDEQVAEIIAAIPKPLTKAETVAAVVEGANIAEDR